MPLPTPKKGEDHQAFMGRCMSNETAMADFPDNKQRVAVCMSKWRDRHGNAGIGPPPKKDAEMSEPLTRAYSLLEVKGINDGERVIQGIATTPDTDHMGDIVESMGAKYRLPVPLLWQHRHDSPVGNVEMAEPNAKGIPFTARIAKVDEPGEVKTLTDKAWQSVKAGLVRGVSIGFKPLESEPIKGGGLRYKSWHWHELSLVTIPAQQNATISLIRSLDEQAASGHADETKTTETPARVGASEQPKSRERTQRMTKKSVADQITAYENTRAAKMARMDDIMDGATERGETLDATEKEEYSGLDTEVKAIDEHLVLLHEREKRAKAAAVPVDKATDIESASHARSLDRTVRVNPVKSEPGIEFARYVMCLAAAKGNHFAAAEFAKARGWEEGAGVIRAAAFGLSTDDTGLGTNNLVYYQNMASEFAAYLRPLTIVGRIPNLRRVPFNIKVPAQTGASTVGWVGEMAPKPVGNLTFTQLTLGHTKIAGIIALSDELVRFSNPSAEMIVRNDLAAGIANYMDVAFCDPSVAAVTNVNPAGITNGVTPITATGTTAAALRTDMQTLLDQFLSNNLNPVGGVWIMTQQQALAISLMLNTLGNPLYPDITATGGTLLGFPVIASEAVPATGNSPTDGGLIIFAKADEILVADDGNVTVDVTTEASLQMNTAPDSPATASTIMISLFQQNMVGIRAERYINWTKRRTTAVSYIQNARYSG